MRFLFVGPVGYIDFVDDIPVAIGQNKVYLHPTHLIMIVFLET
jgi:hypothetical protein